MAGINDLSKKCDFTAKWLAEKTFAIMKLYSKKENKNV